jgi:dienelactone hydrolase
VRYELGIERVGGVGYCFGGKYVGRWLKGDESGLDVGFVAHPTNLLETEIEAIVGPLSIAAGSKHISLHS